MASLPYLYVATSQPPSAVTWTAVGNFSSATDVNLIVAKVSRIEISLITSPTIAEDGSLVGGGVTPLFEVPVNGRVASLQLLRLKNEDKHTLVFTTERLQFVALTYDEATKSLRTIATGDLRDRIGRQIDRGQLVAVDPASRAIALQFYEGTLKIVPCSGGFKEKAYNVLLSEFAVRDLAFLSQSQNIGVRGGASPASSATSDILPASGASASGSPTLAVLYEDESSPGKVCLNCYELDQRQKLLRAGIPRPVQGLDPESSLLLPVASPLGGCIVLARSTVTYVQPQVASTSARNNNFALPYAKASSEEGIETLPLPTPIVPRATCTIDQNRYLVADSTGGLYLLHLKTSSGAFLDDDDESLDEIFDKTGGGASKKNKKEKAPETVTTLLQPAPAASASSSAAAASSASRTARVTGLSWHFLGSTVQASSLQYLGHNLVFVGSKVGNSQVIRLVPEGFTVAAAATDGSVEAAATTTASYLEVVSSYQNLGPIFDMVAIQQENRQGQCQLVTASGAGKDGTLRIVSNGIGIEERAVVELPGITGLWSLKGGAGVGGDRYLLQSYASSTRVFAMGSSNPTSAASGAMMAEDDPSAAEGKGEDGGLEMQEVELQPGLDLEQTTVAAGNLPSSSSSLLLLQVTPTQCRVIKPIPFNGGSGDEEEEKGELVATWSPSGEHAGKRITVATVCGGKNSKRVLLALSGGVLLLLSWDPAASSFTVTAQRTMPNEVSALDASSLSAVGSLSKGGSSSSSMDVDGSSDDNDDAAHFAAVGLWTDATVRLIRLDDPSPLSEVSSPIALGGDMQPRSVLLANLGAAAASAASGGESNTFYLFASLGDGTLFNFRLKGLSPASTAIEVRDRKRVALGTQPVTLSSFYSKGSKHVFASCDRPTVISSSGLPGGASRSSSSSSTSSSSSSSSSSGGKLVYSSVNLTSSLSGVTYMSQLTLTSSGNNDQSSAAGATTECILALASSDGNLLLGGVDDNIQRLHVTTIPLQGQARKVAHHQQSKTIAVAVESTILVNGVASSSSSSSSSSSAAAPPSSSAGAVQTEATFIRLFDDSTYDSVANTSNGSQGLQLDPREVCLSMVTVMLPDPNSNSNSSSTGSSNNSNSDAVALKEYLAVGTAYLLEGEEEPSRGRLLLIDIRPASSSSSSSSAAAATSAVIITGSPRDTVIAAQREVKGGVFSLAYLKHSHKLVAGINSKVQVYHWGPSNKAVKKVAGTSAAAMQTDSSSSSAAAAATSASSSTNMSSFVLTPECGFAGNILTLYLDTRGDFILCGDLMRSIALLRYDCSNATAASSSSSSGGDAAASSSSSSSSFVAGSLEEVAAEPSCNWMTAVSMLDETSFLGAEHHYNLFSAVRKTFNPNTTGGAGSSSSSSSAAGGGTSTTTSVGEDASSYIDVFGEFHLGDMINKIVPGSLVMLQQQQQQGQGALGSESGEGGAGLDEMAGEAGGEGEDDEDDEEEGPHASKRRRTGEGEDVSSSSSSSSSASASAGGAGAGKSGAVAGGKRSGKKSSGAYSHHSSGPRPRLIFGTVGGSIGALISLPLPLYRFLSTLQRAMTLTLQGLGGLSHGHWRSWYSDRRVPNAAAVGGLENPAPRGFIDGDLIELLLDLDRPTQEKIAEMMNSLKAEGAVGSISADVDSAVLHPNGSSSGHASADEIVKAVEELSRLH